MDGKAAINYEKMLRWKVMIIAAIAILLAGALFYSVLVGAARIPVKDAIAAILHMKTESDIAETVVMSLRLPRGLLAALTGLCLGISGTGMQAVLRNPLADPYLLGVSAGASFGAAFAIVIGTSILGAGFAGYEQQTIIVSAFAFGLMTMLLIYGTASLKGGGPETLILAGVAISYIFSAGVAALKYISGHEQLREVTLWLMGGFSGAKWETLNLLMPVVAVGFVLLFRYSWDLNALGAGEDSAKSLGVNVGRLRRNCAVLSSLMASTVVAFTGIIGFIGLVAPHICRMLIGNDHRYLIPCSGLMGALLLLMADTFSRTILGSTEIPVGIVTSLLGAPFFLYMLLRRRRAMY